LLPPLEKEANELLNKVKNDEINMKNLELSVKNEDITVKNRRNYWLN